MSAPLYSIEESLERSVVQTLQGITALSPYAIVAADVSEETDLPLISVRAERQDEVVLGMQTYNARLAVTMTAAADETSDEERDQRRVADSEDDDEGAPGFKADWKTLASTLAAPAFKDSLNALSLVHVWGMEQEPVTYENADRTFSRTFNARLWVNEVQTLQA